MSMLKEIAGLAGIAMLVAPFLAYLVHVGLLGGI